MKQTIKERRERKEKIQRKILPVKGVMIVLSIVLTAVGITAIVGVIVAFFRAFGGGI